MTSVVQNGIDALSLGSLYALVALGIALIFGIMRLINFAHGELITVTAYSTLFFANAPWAILIAGPLLVGILCALAMERLAFRPVRGASPATLLITSFTLSFLIQNILIATMSSTARAVAFPAVVTEALEVGGVRIGKLNIIIVGTGIILLGGVAAFLQRTEIGVQMRGAAEDFLMARLLGVRANTVIAGAFALSGLLAGAVGLIFVAQTGSVTPTLGVSLALVGFVATVIGGLGSMAAAAAGGFVLGVTAVVLQIVLPLNLRPYRDALLFGAVIAILLVRPQGLLVWRARAGAS